MRDTTYAQQVNRRLAAAKSLLVIDTSAKINTTPVGRNAIIESALIQFHFAVYSYLNELLAYYSKPSIEYASLDLSSALNAKNMDLGALSEFLLLKRWGESRGNILFEVSKMPMSLTSLIVADSTEQDVAISSRNSTSGSVNDQTNERIVDAQLIAVSSDKVNTIDLNNSADVMNIIDDFQLFISDQRGNQAEY